MPETLWGPVNADGDRIQWCIFTKRTNSPKLEWIERRLDAAGIIYRRGKERSFHAPFLYVDSARLRAAWDILSPVDDIEDDDPMFLEP